MAKKTRRGQKKCPKCESWIKGTRAKECPKCGHQFNGKQKQAPTPAPEPAAAEKSIKAADTVTLEQIKSVAQTVKAVGGAEHLNEMLGLVKAVGGVKKFKDLVDAISVN